MNVFVTSKLKPLRTDVGESAHGTVVPSGRGNFDKVARSANLRPRGGRIFPSAYLENGCQVFD
jgi:hypothetical protein